MIAAILLIVLAAALWAEANQPTTSTEQQWMAFQTIPGVIVGFLAGEPSGAASMRDGV